MTTTVLSARKILCLDSADTTAEWVAFEDGRITALGSGDPPAAHRRVATEGVLLPGLIDAHVHLTSTGVFRMGLECRDCRSVEELVAKIARFIGKSESKWIAAGAFDPGRNADSRMPDRRELDSVSGDRVLLVTRTDGHSSTLNSAALTALDLDLSLAGTEVDKNEQPTGRLSNGPITPRPESSIRTFRPQRSKKHRGPRAPLRSKRGSPQSMRWVEPRIRTRNSF